MRGRRGKRSAYAVGHVVRALQQAIVGAPEDHARGSVHKAFTLDEIASLVLETDREESLHARTKRLKTARRADLLLERALRRGTFFGP